MREILFRGKQADSGKWVYGFISGLNNDEYGIPMTMNDTEGLCDIIVNPITVGQYTGLTDKNGRRIFEGDIVRFIDIDFDGSERKAVGVIAWNRKAANFDIVKGTYRLDFHYPVFEEIEVIGNIYDNPELLESDIHKVETAESE